MSDGRSSSEEVALAVVREFLARHKFKETLTKLDEECPRTSSSITKRSDIAKALKVERWMKNNKESSSPLVTILDVICRELPESKRAASAKKKSHSEDLESGDSRKISERLGIASKIAPNKPSKPSAPQGGRSHHHASQRKHIASSRPTKSRASARAARTIDPVSSSEEEESDDDNKPMEHIPPQRPKSRVPTQRAAVDRGERTFQRKDVLQQNTEDSSLMMEDIDFDSPSNFLTKGGGRFAKSASHKQGAVEGGHTIDASLATSLKEVVFGSIHASYSSSWKLQNFEFNEQVPFGLVQHEGGPCGVLAVVEAFLLKEFLFGDEKIGLSPSAEQQDAALASALATILCGIKRDIGGPIFVALKGAGAAKGLSRTYKKDGVTEQLLLVECLTEAKVLKVIQDNLHQFKAKDGSGVILLLCGAAITRGIENVRDDMDVGGGGTLMGKHNYCSLEMVNLLMCGYACSNVHDGDKVLGEGKDVLILKGIKKQCTFGLLSLFEHYQSCEVGVNLKCPKLPIWIVYAESHFTVLFSEQASHAYSRPLNSFNLGYYDQLAQLDTPYTLTIDPEAGIPRPDDREVIPPLEHCIRTKWHGASINWGNNDPLYQ